MRDIPHNVADDPVLSAFIEACERPTAQDIVDWTGRHPDRADDIRQVAEILLARTAVEPSPELRARSLAVAERHLAAALAKAHAVHAARATFTSLLAGTGKTVPRLARELDIGRAVLTDLVQGRMTTPLPVRLAAVLATAFETTVEKIEAAATHALAHPRMGRARAEAPPNGHQRSFEDIVRDDPTMTAERKRFWLSGD